MVDTAGTRGGLAPCKEMPYDRPRTKTADTHGPGLGGANHGTAGTQGANSPTHANRGGSPVPWINRGR